MDPLTHSESIVIARPPEEVYDMVSDVTRMGEWSPVCKACRWEEGDGPRLGAIFTGRNETPESTWETKNKVMAADRGKEFAWEVQGTSARWGYTFASVDGGTEVTERWDLPAESVAFFEERFGGDAPAQIAVREQGAITGMKETLAAIKKAAEAG
jgi:Polyketide cyclase / dehydrase and lipid transport